MRINIMLVVLGVTFAKPDARTQIITQVRISMSACNKTKEVVQTLHKYASSRKHRHGAPVAGADHSPLGEAAKETDDDVKRGEVRLAKGCDAEARLCAPHTQAVVPTQYAQGGGGGGGGARRNKQLCISSPIMFVMVEPIDGNSWYDSAHISKGSFMAYSYTSLYRSSRALRYTAQ